MNYRKKAYWIYVVAAVLGVAIVVYGLGLVRQINDVGQAWNSYSKQAVLADEAMHEITRHLGYGGFIHNFKNFVLRRDQGLRKTLENNLTRTRQAVENYRAQDISPQEQQALGELEAVVSHYGRICKQAEELVAQGLEPEVIDQKLAVDEQAVIDAIEVLNTLAEARAIDRRREVEAALSDVTRQIGYGSLLVLLVLLVAIVMVSDRRRLAQATDSIAQTRRYYIELLDAAPDAILVIDDSGRVIRANLQAEKLTGYPRKELLTKSIEDLLPERFRTGHMALRDRAFRDENVRKFGAGSEFLVLTSDGRELPVEISLSYSVQESGRQAIVALRDVSERKFMEAEIREKHEALQTAQSITHLGSWDWDVQTGILDWSDEIYRIFGLKPRSAQPDYGMFMEHIHPDDRERIKQAVSRAIEQDQPYEVEHRVVRPDGSERFVREQGKVFRDKSGKALRMLGTVLDITEQKENERELHLGQAIIEHISQPIIVTDAKRRILDVNDAFVELTGYERGELIGMTPSIMQSGRHDQAFYKGIMHTLDEEGQWQGEIWLRQKDGEAIHRLLAITKVCEQDAQECRYVGLYSDITKLKAHEAELEHLAHFDPLTGLANRMLCHDRLRAAIARASRSHKQVALLYVDLDGFKPVNDRLGHQAGDLLLVEVGERMKQAVREDDTVARIGGDEFAVVFNEVDNREEAGRLGHRLHEHLNIHMGAGETELLITASIGVALYPDDGATFEQLLENADQAMYRAKEEGKNTLAFYRPEAG